MKAIIVFALAAGLGFFLWKRGLLTPAPGAPPLPPPPPAILSEPAPVISEVELQKVMRSASDSDAEVRWQAVLFLDKVKSPRAMPLMEEMLRKDMEPLVRIRIIDLLSNRRAPSIIPTLIESTKDQEAEVRMAALRALEKIGDFTIAPQIINGPIRDQDERVRLQAMKTLNVLQDRKQLEIDAARTRYEAEKAAAQKK